MEAITKQIVQGKSWNLRDLKLPREELIETVRAAAMVPEACKAMIVEAIQQFDPKARFLRLDAHVHMVQTPKGDSHSFTMTLAVW